MALLLRRAVANLSLKPGSRLPKFPSNHFGSETQATISSCNSMLPCRYFLANTVQYRTFISITPNILRNNYRLKNSSIEFQKRTITAISRLGKRKSCKAVLKRFRRVRGGLLKRWRAGMVHKQRKKSSWRKFRLRGSVLVKNKTQIKTLNKMIKVIPTEVVDLDVEPKLRWKHIVEPRKIEIAKFINFLKDLIPFGIFRYLSVSLASGIDKIPHPYNEEIIGISEALEIPLGDILACNIFYELEKLCTSIITQDEHGNIFHARNMDLGAWLGWDIHKQTWKIAELLRPITVNIDFQRNGKTSFKTVQFAGTVGVFTGVKPGMFSFSLNSRSAERMFGGPMSVVAWLLQSEPEDQFASLWARSVLENANSYHEAKELLGTTPLLSPVYYILAGTEVNQGIVISRSKKSSQKPMSLSSDNWYVLQTNYDHWKEPPFYDNRRKPAKICLNKFYEDFNGEQSGKKNGISTMYNVLSTIPIRNKATIYTAIMSAKTGHLETYRRSCTGVCYPW